MTTDLVTINDLSTNEILTLMDDARRLLPVANGKEYLPLLKGKLLGNLFFEPSTRTRMSFETAMKRLGGEVLNLGSVAGSSVVKGETLFDTTKMVEGYTDAIVIRHPSQGAAQYAADTSQKPVINAGDGAGHHPTQTLLDLYTMLDAHGRLNLKVVLAGDLRFGRTVHSLSHALSRFGAELVLVAPRALYMPSQIVSDLTAGGTKVEQSEDLSSAVKDADVVYMTRIQKERFPSVEDYEKVAGTFRLTLADLEGVRPDMIVMHPLPRVDEIHPAIDSTSHQRYFNQAFNGVVTRMALLCRLLGVEIPDSNGGAN